MYTVLKKMRFEQLCAKRHFRAISQLSIQAITLTLLSFDKGRQGQRNIALPCEVSYLIPQRISCLLN